MLGGYTVLKEVINIVTLSEHIHNYHRQTGPLKPPLNLVYLAIL